MIRVQHVPSSDVIARQKDCFCCRAANTVPEPKMKKPGIHQPVRPRVIMRDAATGRWLRFRRAREFVTAWTLADVAPGLRRVEEAVSQEGLCAAGFVSYEAAPAFDGSLAVNEDGHFPLLWFGLYEAAEEVELPAAGALNDAAGAPTSSRLCVAGSQAVPVGPADALSRLKVGAPDWQASVGRKGFDEAMARIKALIRSGDTYQVNYTYRLRAKFTGDPVNLGGATVAARNSLSPRRRSGERVRERGTPTTSLLSSQTPLPSPLPARPSRGEGARWREQPMPGDPWNLFLGLVAAQDPPYGAFLDTGEWVICSASPELFFHLDGARIQCRPMKGTAARGKTQAEDLAQAQALQASNKERAENVMIVDMVRHDLGRIAQPGSVKVASLFEAEKYPTIWQMTSTVEAHTEASLGEIFQTLFPAASVTGAPKVRTMQIIADLERFPRRLYTGAIGFFAPGRRAQFNVAIRTLLVDRRTGCAEYGVGSGITWDSDPEAEWQECRAKARILAPQPPAFSLLETMRWTPAEGYYLLERHLERLQDSALYFSFKLDLALLRLKLGQLAARLGPKPRRIRLLVTKEGGIRLESKVLPTDLACANPLPRIPPLPFRRREGRGEGSVPPPASGSPRAAKRPSGLLMAAGKPQRIALAHAPVDSTAPFLYHKTTNREVYDAARAACPGHDDVLLFNERGEVTESTIANVAVEIAGRLYTPPVACGLLPGTLRAQLLQQDKLVERRIAVAELLQSPRVFLLNSVRGLYAVEVVKAHDG
jgi:para-aminobenzoate synthetase / 4-amino-4-deoxychorismate lyase